MLVWCLHWAAIKIEENLNVNNSPHCDPKTWLMGFFWTNALCPLCWTSPNRVLGKLPPPPPFFFSFKNHMHMDVHIQSRSTAETGKNILLSSCYGGFLAVVSSTYCSELLKCDSSGGQAAFPSAVWQIVPELCKPTGLSLFWIQNQFCWWWWKQNRGHLEKCGWALRHHFKKQ